MATSLSLRFPFPGPPPSRIRLVPFFLPFAGCPQRCVFCDQRVQTGIHHAGLVDALEDLEDVLSGSQGQFGLGFFGGTFTGLDTEWQMRFLGIAARYREQGCVEHVRISTRPDRIDRETLKRLRAGGVDMIELGVQSFDTDVLSQSGRGYSGACALDACAMVKSAGFALGVQLLPGLPGHGAGQWQDDVSAVLGLQPDAVRIYPCVVVAGTELQRMYDCGEYAPWAVDLSVQEIGWALLRFWEKGIRVIRTGLAPEKGMVEKIVAGPWHPAFGNMAKSEALALFLEENIRVAGGCHVVRIQLPQRLSGDLWGHGRSNVERLARIGVIHERVGYWPGSDIVVELEEK